MKETKKSTEQCGCSNKATAVARENKLRENGRGGISILITVLCVIIGVIAGGVLSSMNGSFSYTELIPKNYVRAELEGAATGPILVSIEEAYMKKGAALVKNCVSCHGAGGEGSVTYPPLSGSEWVTGSGVVPGLVVLNGLSGPIKVHGNYFKGKEYNSAMPPMADGWSDYELASILYYVQNSFGNKVGHIYSPEQITELRALSKSYGKAIMSATELEKNLKYVFKAKSLPKETVVDKKTGEVVKENS